MKLTHKFVQPFIETLEEAFPYKVTITDVDGYIIGTSDPLRLNQFHQNAYEIIQGKLPIETLSNLPEGVMLGYGEKIVYDGECIGLIGLIGPPEERQKDIKTAQVMLRLLLDRARVQSDLDLIAADKTSFIVKLLHGASQPERWLKRRASIYGISLDLPRYVIVIRPDISSLTEKQPLELSKMRQNILHFIQQEFADREDLIYGSETGEIIVLTASNGYKDPVRREKFTSKTLQHLLTAIKEQHGVSLLIGVSLELATYSDYELGHQQALSAMEIGKRTENREGIYHYEHMRLGRIVAGFSGETQSILQTSIINKLTAPEHETFLETLNAYFANNMNAAATAQTLFIHRNTLLYRFRQIREVTGYDIRKTDDMVQLRLAVLQYQYFQENDLS